MSFHRSKINNNQIKETGSGFILTTLIGQTVESFSDEDNRYQFTGDNEIFLLINNHRAYIELDDSRYEDLSLVIGMKVHSAQALKEGSLEIIFESRHKLFIPFDVYEAWELGSNASLHIISVAGGNIAIYL